MQEWCRGVLISLEGLLEAQDFFPGMAYGADTHSVVETRQVQQALAKAVLNLSPRKQRIMKLYYMEDKTYYQIADILGVTESRICQIHDECVLDLRRKLWGWIEDRPIGNLMNPYSTDFSDILLPSSRVG